MSSKTLPGNSHIQLIYEKKGNKPNALKVSDNLSIIGSSISLSEYENHTDVQSYFSLKKFLNEVIEVENSKCKYDYIIIDTPPNLSLFTVSALICTDYVIVPVDPSIDSYEALNIMVRTIEDIKSQQNSKIELLGIIANSFDIRTNAAQEQYARINDNYMKHTFKSIIPATTKIREARNSCIPVWNVKGNNSATTALNDLFVEIHEKIKDL